MKESRMRYLFLRIYSNDELTDYVAKMEADGWRIDHGKGNFLSFRPTPKRAEQITVITTECTKRRPEEDELVEESIDIAKTHGWQLACIGDLESVAPARRRLYLYSDDGTATPLEPDKAIDFQYARRAQRTTLFWTVIWTLLFAASLVTTVPFMIHDGPSPILLLLDAALGGLTVSAIFLFVNRQSLYAHVTKDKPRRPDAYRTFRYWERIMIACLALLLVGLVLLLIF